MIVDLKRSDTPYNFTFQIGKELPVDKLEPTHREIRCLVLARYLSYTVAWGKPLPVPDPAEEDVTDVQQAGDGEDGKTLSVRETDDVKVDVNLAEEGKGSKVDMPLESIRQGGMTIFQQTSGRGRTGANVRVLRVEPGGIMIIVMILLVLYLFSW